MNEPEITSKDFINQEFEEFASKVKQLGLATPLLFILTMHRPLIGMASIVIEAFMPVIILLFGKKNSELMLLALSNKENYLLLEQKLEKDLN
jgi:hypothetical protein